MSQAGIVNISGGGGGGGPIETLTGNSGGAVPPTANNIFVLGAAGINVVGNPGTSTLTISLTEDAPSYVNVVGPITYVVTSTDYYLSCDSTAGIVTIKLPDNPDPNRQFIVKDRTGQSPMNNIFITTVSGVTTIDILETIYDLTDAFEAVEMLYHSSNYEIF